MKIKVIKSAPWKIGANLKNFVEGQTLEVGVDVPDAIAEDMLRCDYAVPKKGRPRIETKEEGTTSSDAEPDIDAMDKYALEIYARENLGIELDRRKTEKALRKQVRTAMKEKNNE